MKRSTAQAMSVFAFATALVLGTAMTAQAPFDGEDNTKGIPTLSAKGNVFRVTWHGLRLDYLERGAAGPWRIRDVSTWPVSRSCSDSSVPFRVSDFLLRVSVFPRLRRWNSHPLRRGLAEAAASGRKRRHCLSVSASVAA